MNKLAPMQPPSVLPPGPPPTSITRALTMCLTEPTTPLCPLDPLGNAAAHAVSAHLAAQNILDLEIGDGDLSWLGTLTVAYTNIAAAMWSQDLVAIADASAVMERMADELRQRAELQAAIEATNIEPPKVTP